MERKKAKGSIYIDEMGDLVKASAWAWGWGWYRHHNNNTLSCRRAADEKGGSAGAAGGRVAKEMEYDEHLPSARKPPKPSSSIYKLEEAMTSSSPVVSVSESSQQAEISLLDSYEIQRISRQLDVYIKSSRDEYFRSLFVTTTTTCHSKSAQRDNCRKDVDVDVAAEEKKLKHKKKKKQEEEEDDLDGVWSLLPPCCSSRHDDVVVVEAPLNNRSKMEISRSRGRHGNHQAMVVKAASCRPRRG